METRRNTMRGGPVFRTAWARVALIATPLFVLVGLFVSACSDEENPFRRGFTGDSCSRTDDCADPLRCVDNVCTEPPSSLADAGPDAFGPGPGPSASEGPWSACDECLEMECSAAEKNCGPDCRAIQGCIETTCVGLSASASMDEGECQIQCQSKHAAGKDQHLAVVNCAVDTKCQPPCTFYPQDYDLCRTFMNNGDCYGYNQACENSLNCKNFRDCISFCASLPDCLACDDTPELAQGRAILEAYELCVAAECVAESWIP
jgi:hypothetical protein